MKSPGPCEWHLLLGRFGMVSELCMFQMAFGTPTPNGIPRTKPSPLPGATKLSYTCTTPKESKGEGGSSYAGLRELNMHGYVLELPSEVPRRLWAVIVISFHRARRSKPNRMNKGSVGRGRFGDCGRKLWSTVWQWLWRNQPNRLNGLAMLAPPVWHIKGHK